MKKIDEMEMTISRIAIKAAWIYIIVFLVIWDIYDYIHTGKLGIVNFLLITQGLVLISIQSFLKWKLCKDEK
ncbi:hypothetical protein K9O30_16255 [Clostridium bowmanii]|uniref:hypothetical protein n=1 Tax=Clostridium bowmanii TaxID=132925 RepID=UPI001C0DFBFF|nr:hypothetical protein [Clostridium bowmanii]MBU3190853.1 hypothetical protein [Clostridium bowmanii]MCA1075242.1 hypothetical protein [Clostridium bowmanii]